MSRPNEPAIPPTPEQEAWLRAQLAGLAPACPRPHLPHLGDPCAVCGRPVTDALQFDWCESCGRAMHSGHTWEKEWPQDAHGYLVAVCPPCWRGRSR